MASIGKVKKGYRAQIKKKGVRLSRVFDTKREAQAWATEQEALILSGDYKNDSNATIKQACEKYIEEETHTYKHPKKIITRIRHVYSRLPDIKLKDLTSNHIAEFRNQRLKEIKSESVRKDLGALSVVIKIAINEWGWITNNPMATVKLPPKGKPRMRGITQEEINKLKESFRWDETIAESRQDETIIAFLIAIESAMRLSEVLSIGKHTDLERRVHKLLDTKNGDIREVPLSQRAVDLINYLPEKRFNISSGVATQYFMRARDKAGLTFRFHDSRSEALTRLSKKLDVLQLAKMVGHRDPRSLMIYYAEKAEDIAKLL